MQELEELRLELKRAREHARFVEAQLSMEQGRCAQAEKQVRQLRMASQENEEQAEELIVTVNLL